MFSFLWESHEIEFIKIPVFIGRKPVAILLSAFLCEFMFYTSPKY